MTNERTTKMHIFTTNDRTTNNRTNNDQTTNVTERLMTKPTNVTERFKTERNLFKKLFI